MKVLLVAILALSFCGLIVAQTQPKFGSKQFSDQLYEKEAVLAKHSQNVLEMLQGFISDTDKQSGNWAFDREEKFDDRIGEILTLSYMYQEMVDGRDKKIAKKYLILSCASAGKIGLKSAEEINRMLPSIKSIALINEITQMRDDVLNVMRLLEVCKK